MLPEYFRTNIEDSKQDKPAFEKDNFGQRKMLADEPEQPLFNDIDHIKGLEESAFDKSEAHDK